MHFTRAVGSSRPRGTILIADVSDRSARVYASVCQLGGYATIVCRPEELAAPLPIGCRPDIVLFGMGQANAPPPAIRFEGAALPVVLVSASPADADRVTELGYAAVIVRPVAPARLRETIGGVLSVHHRQERGPGAAPGDDARCASATRHITPKDYEHVRQTSQRLRDESRQLCRHAGDVRRRATQWLTAWPALYG